MQTAVKAKKPRKQAISGRFWAGRTYRERIKDDHKTDSVRDIPGLLISRGIICFLPADEDNTTVFSDLTPDQHQSAVFLPKGIQTVRAFSCNDV